MTLKAVVLDSREPAWVQELEFGVSKTITTLPIGDAWLATEDTTLVCERKTLADLLASIRDGRLFTQAAAMVRQSIWSYEVVTELPVIKSGCVWAGGKLTNWKWSSVQGALLTLQDIGVQVVFWPNSHQGYADAIKFLAGRDRGTVKVHPQKREVVMQSDGEQLLTSINGIGDKKAAALIKHCGCAAEALCFLADDNGKGGETYWPKDAPRITVADRASTKLALGTPDDLRLAVIGKESEA
jgi:ERCC4-type nuclease